MRVVDVMELSLRSQGEAVKVRKGTTRQLEAESLEGRRSQQGDVNGTALRRVESEQNGRTGGAARRKGRAY